MSDEREPHTSDAIPPENLLFFGPGQEMLIEWQDKVNDLLNLQAESAARSIAPEDEYRGILAAAEVESMDWPEELPG